jgi:hypothetical protein
MLHWLTWAAGLPSAGGLGRSWYAIPLIVVISLVYSASRHESPELIVRRSLRLALTITSFMFAVLLVLLFMSRGMELGESRQPES